MQFVELTGIDTGGMFSPTDGAGYVKELFACPIYSLVYIVWLGALWFHLTHGIWSALHSLGLNNNTWMPRVKCISNIASTIIVLMFASVVVYYYVISLF
jgi:succinate dehydrogenase / fumarate reductase cytochrome b subunit